MKSALGFAAVPGLVLLVGCNLLLGTEDPVLRGVESGGVGGGAVSVGASGTGGDDLISIADGGDPSSSSTGAGGSAVGACADGGWTHWAPDGAHGYQISTGPMLEQVVSDSLTGLDWQRVPSSTAVSWSLAAVRCKLLKWAGLGGWRLPTRVELLSIVDYTQVGPSIDGAVFPGTPSDRYWTSSASKYVPEPPGSAFFRVSFVEGGSFPGMTGSDVGHYRCVRGGAPPLPGGAVNGCYRYILTPTTAKDVETGLTWERGASDLPLLRGDAADRCAKLGGTGMTWRLPTIAELSSILDVGRAEPPRVDPVAFSTGTLDAADWFWSSTADAKDPSAAAWAIRAFYGTVSELASPGPAYVRCVH